MDYGKIISRAANIVWDHKFLMVLGFLAALGGGSTFNFDFNSQGGDFRGFNPNQMPGGGNFPFDLPFRGGFEAAPRLTFLALLALCLGFFLALLLFVVSNVARGGLIAAVDAIEEGGRPTFSAAWRAGWHRLWTLLGIGILPAIPFFIIFMVGLLGFLGMTGLRAVNASPAQMGIPFGGVAAILICLLVPVSLLLGLLRTFANRAAMLEGQGTLDAYGRGFSVLMANLGEAILLFLLQIVISIGLFVVFFLPGIFVALCCLLWPLLMLFQGAVAAFFSALWTLAWRQWTVGGKVVDKVKMVG